MLETLKIEVDFDPLGLGHSVQEAYRGSGYATLILLHLLERPTHRSAKLRLRLPQDPSPRPYRVADVSIDRSFE